MNRSRNWRATGRLLCPKGIWKAVLPLGLAAVLPSCHKMADKPELIYVETASSASVEPVRSSGDPADAELLTLNRQQDTDGTTYYALYWDGFVEGKVYKVDEAIDLSSCRIDPTYGQPAGPHSFKWTAPSGKYAIVVKPEYSIVYMFRIKGTGGDYDGWTPSAGGGTDKTGRNKRMMFMVGCGMGVCERFCADADWCLATPATLHANGKVDGTNQPVMLNLEATDYSSTAVNRFSAIVRFSKDKPVEFGFAGCTDCVWPINFGASNRIVADQSLTLALSEKRDLGPFLITIPTIRVLNADYDSWYKITVSGTANGIDVIWANLSIEKY